MSLTGSASRRIPSLQCLAKRSMSRKAISPTRPPPSRRTSAGAPSSPLPKGVQSHTTLPPPKIRALISLYHQADKWITPDILLARIDEAFVPAPSADVMDLLTDDKDITLDQLRDKLDEIKTAPRMVQADSVQNNKPRRRDPESDPKDDRNWSDIRTKREAMVFGALYGVNMDADGRILPGLEVLQEMSETLSKHRKDDEESEGGMDVQDLLKP